MSNNNSSGAGIGTGLWVGTGSALSKAGPAGIAITYTIMALVPGD